ncbi:hypothetical protein QJQ45_012261 [Haematococcus lacustris]|nr:hypothetical protein QJQ45_012261 [Haematococcus lacustris]
MSFFRPHAPRSYRTPPALMAKLTTGASRQSSLAQDSTGERAKRLLAAANAYLKVKRGQPQPSMAAVAQEHCVPYATLRRVIKRGGVIAKRGRPTALSAVEEEQLRDLVVRGQQQGVGVTKTALLAAVRTTQRVTERKGKVDPFKGKAPGKKWRQGFMRRQGLSLRKATPVSFYPQSSIILKEGTHMMDGRLFPKLLDVMAKQIPGGVSPTNRALLVLDGHASRFSNDTKEAARVHGFDLVILPAQCTSFLQPWDQLFGSVKAQYQKLLGQAAFLADGEGFNPAPSQIISLVDTAMHYSVGFSMQPLQRAFEKTGLFPPDKDNMLAAATASMEGGRQQPAFKPWVPLTVDAAMLRVAAQRSAQPQPSLRFPAEDRFYFKHEVVAEAAKKAAKANKRSCK